MIRNNTTLVVLIIGTWRYICVISSPSNSGGVAWLIFYRCCTDDNKNHRQIDDGLVKGLMV